jgi:hypothetical protein
MLEFPTNPPQKQYIYFFWYPHDRSVNGEIIYIPNSLNESGVDIILKKKKMGSLQLNISLVKHMQKKFDLSKNYIRSKNICHDLIIKIS